MVYDPDILPNFIFRMKWVPAFRMLTLSQRGLLLNYMFWYCFEEAEPNEEDLEIIGWRGRNLWAVIKADLDEQFETWKRSKYFNQ